MGDIYKEQLIKKLPSTLDTLKKVGIISAALILAAVSFFIPILSSIAPLLIVGLGFGVYYLMSMFRIEYEYIFTNGIFDIDIIYSKSRRKQIFTGNVRDFDIMANINNKECLPDFRSADTVLNYSSGIVKSNTYAFLTTYEGKKVKIIIEPNEMLEQAFATVLTPRKFIR